MSTPTPNGELALEYLQRYPSYSSLRLAGMLMSAAPGAFRDREAARKVVRYYRGSTGTKDRVKMNPENFVPRISVEPSASLVWEPFFLTKEDFPVAVGCDAHVPYHDQDILEMFVEDCLQRKVKTIVFDGDWWDCYQLSKFLTDPRKRHTEQELETLLSVLRAIREAVGPSVKFIYKLGNHEERLEHYLMRQAPELFGIKLFTWESLLHADELNMTIVKDKRLIKYNKLTIIHGHEFRSGFNSPINPARMLFLKAKRPTIEGHYHQTSEFTGKAINDDTTTCWSTGCMCDLHPEYAPLNEWNHGYVFIDVDDTGFWTVTNRKIVNYRFYV